MSKKADKCSNGNEKKKSSRSNKFISDVAKAVAQKTGQPITFLLAFSVIIIWAVTGPLFEFNDTWQLVINTGTTIITFLMVFLIQNTQNRDSEAVQLKLDELIRALDEAENETIALEEKSQEELDEIKERYTRLATAAHHELESREAS